MMRFGKIIEVLPRVNERKDGLFAQLYDLAMLADKLGCSKAASFLRKITTNPQQTKKETE